MYPGHRSRRCLWEGTAARQLPDQRSKNDSEGLLTIVKGIAGGVQNFAGALVLLGDLAPRPRVEGHLVERRSVGSLEDVLR